MTKALFISAVPDDAEIGCGGTISRYVEEGIACHLAVMVGPSGERLNATVGFERRRAEQELSARKLKIKQVHWLDIGAVDQLDVAPLSKGVQALEKLLTTETFDVVFCPLAGSGDAHRFTWNVAMALCRPGPNTATWYAYEQPQGVYEPQPLQSRLYFKLEQKHLDLKESALLCHRSQLTGRVHSLTGVAGVMVLAELRGLECGSEFAEVFHLLRAVR